MNNKKLPLSVYLLAIPPMAQWFLVWYAWQAIKLAKINGVKHTAKGVYAQTALATNKDATALNEAVEKFHQDEAKEPIRKLKHYENVAILSLFLTGLAFFALPENERMSVVQPIAMAMNAPAAADSVIKHHFNFNIPHKGD